MPTPLGHALAGLAIGWSAEAIRRQPIRLAPRSSLVMTCAMLAVAPDLDFLDPPLHRMMTHSLTAAVLATAVVVWLRRRTAMRPLGLIALVCAVAYGSHLLLDWLGGDTKLPPGILLLWPFSDRWFISPWPVFQATELRGFFRVPVMAANALAVLQEVAILAPLAAGAFLWRRRMLAPPAAGDRWTPARLRSQDPVK